LASQITNFSRLSQENMENRMNRSKKIIVSLVIGAVALVAVFGAFTYQLAYAQSSTPTPGNGTAQGQLPPGGPGRDGRGGPGVGVTDDNLAAALGITTDQLQAAEKTADAEALKEAVSKGIITQDQADQMSSKGFPGRHFGGPDGIDYNAMLAKALNISSDQLTAAQQEAFKTTITNAVNDGSITQAQADAVLARNALANDQKFQASMNTAYEAALKQAVSDGTITQAQADALLQEQPQQWSGGPGFGPGGHHFGGRGLPGTKPGDTNQGQNTNSQNS
jgi:hypothetical protein